MPLEGEGWWMPGTAKINAAIRWAGGVSERLMLFTASRGT